MYRPRSDAGQHVWNIASFIDTALARGGQPLLFTLTIQTNQFYFVLDAGYASVPEKDLPATKAGFSSGRIPQEFQRHSQLLLRRSYLPTPSIGHQFLTISSCYLQTP
jgi:hypothetical protein